MATQHHVSHVTQAVPERTACEGTHVQHAIGTDRVGGNKQTAGVDRQIDHECPTGRMRRLGRPVGCRVAIYPQVGKAVTADRLQNGPSPCPIADVSSASLAMQPMDDVGVEATADHQQEDPPVGPAGVESHDRSLAKQLCHGPRVAPDCQVASQQIRCPQREDRHRYARLGAIDDLGHGAVATCRQDGPQLAACLVVGSQGGQCVEIADDLGRHAAVTEARNQVRN